MKEIDEYQLQTITDSKPDWSEAGKSCYMLGLIVKDLMKEINEIKEQLKSKE